MKDVDKFTELLISYSYESEKIGRSTTLTELNVLLPRQLKLQQELIQMYKEDEEWYNERYKLPKTSGKDRRGMVRSENSWLRETRGYFE